jgi:hypothetical protein
VAGEQHLADDRKELRRGEARLPLDRRRYQRTQGIVLIATFVAFVDQRHEVVVEFHHRTSDLFATLVAQQVQVSGDHFVAPVLEHRHVGAVQTQDVGDHGQRQGIAN